LHESCKSLDDLYGVEIAPGQHREFLKTLECIEILAEAAEALARGEYKSARAAARAAGIGRFLLADPDLVESRNLGFWRFHHSTARSLFPFKLSSRALALR
jgi:hypothetical protein